MTPLDYYAAYRIYRGLALHQLRVAAVGRSVAQRARRSADVELVTLVGLFHDMGNIIKADLPRYPEFAEPEGVAYWLPIQQEFRARYGADEHSATDAICREMGLCEQVLDIIDQMRFSRTEWIAREGSLEAKICKYADLRVSPWGVLPMQERLAEARARYGGRPMDKGDAYTPESLAHAALVCESIEAELSSLCAFRPEDITDASIAPLIEELKGYQILSTDGR